MLCRSVFIICSVFGLFVPFVKDPSVRTTEVSSTYVMNLKALLACEKSLIYIMNNREPSIEPCGTPVFIENLVLSLVGPRVYREPSIEPCGTPMFIEDLVLSLVGPPCL